ncbi:MAG TPA: hypothetical protein VIK91_23460, partial [Nannocystis sp.]
MRVFALLFAVLTVLVGGPAAARPSITDVGLEFFVQAATAGVPQELYGQPIVDIRFEGNRRVESEAMLLELESHVDALVNPRNLALDIKRLWGLGKFDDIRIEAEQTPA